MRSIGFPVFAYKLGAFVLAGALGGTGRLSRRLPIWFRQSGNSRLAPVRHRADDGDPRRHGPAPRRGHRRVRLMFCCRNFFSAPALFGAYAKHWQLAMGGLIVIIVLALPHGIGGLFDIVIAPAFRRGDSESATRGSSND